MSPNAKKIPWVAAIGTAATLVPLFLYAASRNWLYALLIYPMALVSGGMAIFTVVRRKWFAASMCVLAPLVALGLVRLDAKLLPGRVRLAAESYRAAGQAAISGSAEECGDPDPTRFSEWANYRCDVTSHLGGPQKSLAPLVMVTAPGGRKKALFFLRTRSRMVVAYAPGVAHYPCERIAEDTYLCGFLPDDSHGHPNLPSMSPR